MKINYLDQNPREIRLEEDLPPYMNEGVADDIAEIFNTLYLEHITGITRSKIIGLRSFMSLERS